MRASEGHELALSAARWTTIRYTVPALALLIASAFLKTQEIYLLPILVVYGIGVISYQLSYNFMAHSVQIKMAIDYIVAKATEQTPEQTSN